ncbi:Nn.00g099390.m01.CDS01 [Neocucurbitaria sp. VM-36]
MAPPQLSASSIPLFYRIFFTWVDPIICVWGAYMDFFDPTLVLSSHIPHPTPDIGHAMILKQRGGGMLNFGFVSAVLLRYTYDLKVWSIVQIADFIVDVAYFWAVYAVLSEQGRLDVSTWRAEDWGSVAITGTAGLVRLGFLAGVGFKKGTRNVRKRS